MIRASHNGKFVAINKEEVVSHRKSFMTLVESLKKEYDDLSRFVNELINESNNICFVNSK